MMTLPIAAGIGLGLVLALFGLAWRVSLRLDDAGVADVVWGPGFVLLAWVYVGVFDTPGMRPIVIAVFITVWGLRLGWHLWRRRRGKPEDPRYRSMRAAHGTAFRWRSLFTVFGLQAAILWFVALPSLVAAAGPGPPRVTWLDVAGTLLFVIGLTFEVVGDRQLERFRAAPGNRGRVLDTGVWCYTRHPNYFGDATLWWGLFLLAASSPNGWLTVGSPVLMTLLLWRGSGVPLLERHLAGSRPGYRDYVARTSAFVPWPPRRHGSGG